MSLTIKELEHLARLCAIYMSEDDKLKYLKQIDWILEFVWQLKDVDVDWIEPMSHPLENKTLTLRSWVSEFVDNDRLFENVKHQLKNKWVVIKSPIKS